MEIKTIIEGIQFAPFEPPVFKHPFEKAQARDCEYYSHESISIPDKTVMKQSNQFFQRQDNRHCVILYGFEIKVQDWQNIIKEYNLDQNPSFDIQIRKFKGNEEKKIDKSVLKSKSYCKGQKVLNEALLLKNGNRNEGITVYSVTLGRSKNIVVYYIPFCEENHVSMNEIKLRYFNNKFLQILNEYVTLDNTNTTCYKDQAHQHFQSLVYSGNVSAFTVYVQINEKILIQQNSEICERFIEKISGISLTDKHLLDEMDTSNLIELKKQIKDIYLEENRLRINITERKTKIVEQLDFILELFDLKNHYPNKMTFSQINSEMFRRIRNKNIQKNQEWIQEQKVINSNLDLRLKDLEKVKKELLEKEIVSKEQQRREIQAIRNQIIDLEKKIQFQKSEINIKLFEEARKEKEKQQKDFKKNKNPEKKGTDSIVKVTSTSVRKETLGEIQNFQKKYSEIMEQIKKEQGQKYMKNQMIKSLFAMEKEYVQKREDYAKASEELFNYLLDF